MAARRTLGAALWVWGRVLICLLALDAAVFRTGQTWAHVGAEPILGRWWFGIARAIGAASPQEPVAYVIGSSVVGRGLGTAAVEPGLPRAGRPGRVVKLSVASDLLVLLNALLIALCVLYRPEEAFEFIYAGF